MAKQKSSGENSTDAWMAEPGDHVTGEMTALDRGTSEYGPYPIVWLRVKDGTMGGMPLVEGRQIAIHAFRHVLKSQFAKWRPIAGELVSIEMVSAPEGKGIGQYYNYRVSVEGREVTAADWDNMFGPPTRIGVDATPPNLGDDPPF